MYTVSKFDKIFDWINNIGTTDEAPKQKTIHRYIEMWKTDSVTSFNLTENYLVIRFGKPKIHIKIDFLQEFYNYVKDLNTPIAKFNLENLNKVLDI